MKKVHIGTSSAKYGSIKNNTMRKVCDFSSEDEDEDGCDDQLCAAAAAVRTVFWRRRPRRTPTWSCDRLNVDDFSKAYQLTEETQTVHRGRRRVH